MRVRCFGGPLDGQVIETTPWSRWFRPPEGNGALYGLMEIRGVRCAVLDGYPHHRVIDQVVTVEALAAVPWVAGWIGP